MLPLLFSNAATGWASAPPTCAATTSPLPPISKVSGDFASAPTSASSYTQSARINSQSPAPAASGASTRPIPARASERRNLSDERSEEHTSELQSLMRISYAVFCLKKKKTKQQKNKSN